MTARKKLNMIEKITAERKKNYDISQDMSKELILITDAYYRTALDNQMKARSDYYAKRAALEQFVGNEDLIIKVKNASHNSGWEEIYPKVWFEK